MQTKTSFSAAAAAVMATAAMVLALSATDASARHRGRHAGKAGKVVLVPARLKPGYVGAQGYPGGPPGPRVPTLIDLGSPLVLGL